MGQKNRVAIFVVGILGAAIGGILGYQMGGPVESGWQSFRHISSPVGVVSGFLVCFFIAKKALKTMKGKSWKAAFLFGPLYGSQGIF